MGAFDDLMPSSAPAGGGAFADLVPAGKLTKLDKFVKGLRDPIDGGAQLLTKVLPDSVVSAGNDLNNFIADKTGLVGRLPEGGVDQQVRQNEATYQAARMASEPRDLTSLITGQQPKPGFDGYRVAGNILNPANLAIAARAPAAIGLGGKILSGAGTGAVSSLLNPVTDGDSYLTEKAKQVGIGAAFGGAVPAVTAGIGRLISPKASVNPDIDLLKAEGVNPTIGQTLGGWANKAEEKAMSIPLLGDAIAYARGNARDQFNKAAINRAVQPIGEKVDEAGQAGIQKAGNLLSDAYENAIDKVKVVQFDKQFANDVAQLQSMSKNMTPELAARFEKTLQEVVGPRISGNGSMLGATYKQVDSKLGQEAAKFGKSSDPLQKELGDAYAQLQNLLKQQAQRSSPGFADAIKNADKGWANLVRVEGAGKAALNSEGVFTPGQLNAAIRQADQSTRGRAVARGTALMQDLGTAGQNVLGNKVPNSATADRLMLGGAGIGAGLINPLIPAGLLGGAAMYTPAMQKLLTGAVTARPESAQAIRDALLKASPLLGPGAAQVGIGLLN